MPKQISVASEWSEISDSRPQDHEYVNPLTRNTKSNTFDDLEPGEFREDGAYKDAYGHTHYSNGGVYKGATKDRRLTANGAFSGKHAPKAFTPEEIAENPFLGLQPKDKITLLMHLEGRSRGEIANELEISEQTVTTRLAKKSVKACLVRVKEGYEQDLHSLTGLATQAVREGLESSDLETKLRAADRVFKTTGRFDRKVESQGGTATDHINQVLAALQVNVNIINEGRDDKSA